MGDMHRAIPWHDDEYVVYRGVKLIYTIAYSGDVVVHFPGGEKVSIQKLSGAKPPKQWRKGMV